MTENNFVLWTKEYDYVKDHYQVLLPSGEKVICWPNAGVMSATDGSGREFTPDGSILIRKLTDEEFYNFYDSIGSENVEKEITNCGICKTKTALDSSLCANCDMSNEDQKWSEGDTE